ncbi:MAG: S8 family serine peptidase [Hyphomonadaceae bacterium]|nr:S8 family serine peptidase [Hyphomonadaceae bacterium]
MLVAAGAEAQAPDRSTRIDRIDRASRAADIDRSAKRAIERRQAQAAASDQQQPAEPSDPLVADDRLARARDGFAARRGEILALDMSDAARTAALGAGMTVISDARLGSAGPQLTRLNAPAPLDPGAMLDLLRAADPGGLFDFNHAFAASGPTPQQQQPELPAMQAGGRYRIGMIDGGVLVSHADLRAAAITQRAFPAASGPVATDHGTAVAGKLAETFDAPFALLAADVLTETGAKWTGADALAEALAWMTAERVGIVNISLAGPPNVIVGRMVALHLTSGGEIIAAAGNNGPFSQLIYPAAYPGVIGVTAVDAAGGVWPMASTGSHVDRSAPGVDVTVATLSGHAVVSGTSYAAPVVAARMAIEEAAPAATLATVR